MDSKTINHLYDADNLEGIKKQFITDIENAKTRAEVDRLEKVQEDIIDSVIESKLGYTHGNIVPKEIFAKWQIERRVIREKFETDALVMARYRRKQAISPSHIAGPDARGHGGKRATLRNRKIKKSRKGKSRKNQRISRRHR
jgi:hypothetical protein